MAQTEEYGQDYLRLPATMAPRPEHRASGRPARTMVEFLEAYHGTDGHPVAGSAAGAISGAQAAP